MKTVDPRISQGVAVLVAGIVAIGSWRWGYQPAVRAHQQDEQQVAALSTRLAQVEAMVQTAGGVKTWQTHNLQRLATLKNRFPPQAQVPQLLNALVDAVKTGEVTLLNVSQGNVEPVLDAGQPVLIEGQPCYRLSVTMTAEGRYHALIEALARITAETFPSVVSIAQADFRVKDPLGAQLAATLQLYLYVVGTPSEPAPDA